MKIKRFDMSIESLRNENVIMAHQLIFRLNTLFRNQSFKNKNLEMPYYFHLLFQWDKIK